MELKRWALIAEIVGGISIVLSLLFVGYEVQRNSQAQIQATTQELVSSYTDIVGLMTQDERLRCAYVVGIGDFTALQGTDAVAFSAYWLAMFRHREDMYLQYLQGAVTPEVWDGFDGTTRESAQYPGFQQWFEGRRSWFGQPFRDYIDSLMGPPADVVPYQGSECLSRE